MKTCTVKNTLRYILGPSPKEALAVANNNMLGAYVLIAVCVIHIAVLVILGPISLAAWLIYGDTYSMMTLVQGLLAFASYHTIFQLTSLKLAALEADNGSV